MTKHAHTIAFLLALTACHGPIPEGRFPCTIASDCPARWSCHADRLCWSMAEVVADAGVDAFASDASMMDAGPTCTTETCNGADDDCDGLVDEGVITVGPAVSVTAMDLPGATIIGQASGFGIMTSDGATPSNPTWLLSTDVGSPSGSPPLGADVAIAFPFPPTIAADARQILVASANETTTEDLVLFGFDPTTGARGTGSPPLVLPFPSGWQRNAYSVFADVSAGHATLYAGASDAAFAHVSIFRFRLDVSGPIPRVLDTRQVAGDVDATISGFAALATADADYVAYRRSTGNVVLVAGPAGDGVGAFHDVGVIASASDGAMMYATMAVDDPTAPISGSNPLAIAWTGRITTAGAGGPRFVQVTNTTVIAATTPLTFADGNGVFGGFYTVHTIGLLAVGDAPGHWLLVNQDAESSTMGALVQVRELIGGGSTVRRIPVPNELSAGRSDVGVARSGTGSIRLVERANSMGLVTRSIGCE